MGFVRKFYFGNLKDQALPWPAIYNKRTETQLSWAGLRDLFRVDFGFYHYYNFFLGGLLQLLEIKSKEEKVPHILDMVDL